MERYTWRPQKALSFGACGFESHPPHRDDGLQGFREGGVAGEHARPVGGTDEVVIRQVAEDWASAGGGCRRAGASTATPATQPT